MLIMLADACHGLTRRIAGEQETRTKVTVLYGGGDGTSKFS